MTNPITILIVDDHRMVREGLKTFIKPIPDLSVIGEAENGAEAVRLATALQPDVILMDLMMPEMDGMEAVRRIIQQNPRARILTITSFGEDERITRTIQAGALGYLLKDSSPQELETAIRTVFRGTLYLPSPRVQKWLPQPGESTPQPDPCETLTPREHEVMQLVGEGRTNEEIAATLFISVWTVRTHVWRIMKKLQLEDRTQVALYSVKQLRHDL